MSRICFRSLVPRRHHANAHAIVNKHLCRTTAIFRLLRVAQEQIHALPPRRTVGGLGGQAFNSFLWRTCWTNALRKITNPPELQRQPLLLAQLQLMVLVLLCHVLFKRMWTTQSTFWLHLIRADKEHSQIDLWFGRSLELRSRVLGQPPRDRADLRTPSIRWRGTGCARVMARIRKAWRQAQRLDRRGPKIRSILTSPWATAKIRRMKVCYGLGM
mmetsp:Transcript_3021/g.6527  ORF Transcript_3021/g.6527 Transcript_3021/m.6527 type:complete len:215 (+) Transcript_3021:379-1023(+)